MSKRKTMIYEEMKGADTDFEKNCCFCGREVVGIGHNPKPVEMREGAVCCDFCDCNIVLRERLRMLWEEEDMEE